MKYLKVVQILVDEEVNKIEAMNEDNHAEDMGKELYEMIDDSKYEEQINLDEQTIKDSEKSMQTYGKFVNSYTTN